MIIDRLNSEKLLVSLGVDDIEQLSLKLDCPFPDLRTKNIILRLVTLACRKSGMDCFERSFKIEALPHETGCLLLVTIMSQEKKRAVYRIKKKKEVYCFIFQNCDDFLSAYSHLKLKNKRLIKHMKLYNINENERYMISFGEIALPNSTVHLLCEYGKRVKKSLLFLSRLNENNNL